MQCVRDRVARNASLETSLLVDLSHSVNRRCAARDSLARLAMRRVDNHRAPCFFGTRIDLELENNSTRVAAIVVGGFRRTA
jgi:hypothetical protein